MGLFPVCLGISCTKGLKTNTTFQVWPHQNWVEEMDRFSWPASNTLPNPQPRIQIAFLVARTHCWRMFNLASPGTLRFFSAELLSSWILLACVGAWGRSSADAVSLCWTSWDFSRPTSPAYQVSSGCLCDPLMNQPLPPVLHCLQIYWSAGKAASIGRLQEFCPGRSWWNGPKQQSSPEDLMG